jgi:hypothetical protein
LTAGEKRSPLDAVQAAEGERNRGPMLSFRIVDSATIEIDCDAAGMATLMGALAKLVGERASHVHLCAPPRGKALSDETIHGEPAATEVIINYAEGD